MESAIKKASPEMQIVHRDAIDNLLFLKKQQWMITNYVIIIFAVIYTLNGTIDRISTFEKQVLTMVLSVALFLGVLLIIYTQYGMVKSRKRLRYFYGKYFTCVEREALSLSLTRNLFWRDWPFFIGLIGTAIIAALMVLWGIWRCVPTM